MVVPEVANRPPASPPDVTDIRQDLERFDSQNRIPAAKIRVVTTMAGIYRIGNSPRYHKAFHDVTAGGQLGG